MDKFKIQLPTKCFTVDGKNCYNVMVRMLHGVFSISGGRGSVLAWTTKVTPKQQPCER